MAEVTVTTEQVHELIQQLAAMNVAASITPQIVANIFEKMRNLNDQEKDKIIAITQAYLQELNQAGIVGFISRETTEDEEEIIVIKDNSENIVGSIDPGGADFSNLKRGGQQVARMSDLPTKDNAIGENPSTTNVPTTKAVKDYVDAHNPIEKETTQSEVEEQVWGNNAETQEYAKIGPYGIKSKAFLDMQGKSIIDGDIGNTPSTTHAPSSKAVAEYVRAHGGGGNLPISQEGTDTQYEEIEMTSDDGSETYTKFTSEGLYAKKYFLLDGTPIESGSSKAVTPASASSIPIVVFIYDDNNSNDDTLVSMLEARGLKATLATIGTIVNLTPQNALGQKLAGWVRRGHGTIGHGCVHGVTVNPPSGSFPGLSNIRDSEAIAAIEGNNTFLDLFNLSHNGIAYWNNWENNPHTQSLVGKYYNYGFVFGGSGYNTPNMNPWKFTRYSTDSNTMLTGAKALVDRAIGHNCIIAFGGHMERTGTGTGSYSTMAQFTELLDYIAEKVSNRQMIGLNSDDAIAAMFSRGNMWGGVKSEAPYIPALGNAYYNGGVKICTNEGALSVYDIAFSGTPTDGEISLDNIKTLDGGENLVITISSSMSLEDVVNACLTKVYKRFTPIKKDTSTLRLYSDVAEIASIPAVNTNTSGLTITITQVVEGAAPTWS